MAIEITSRFAARSLVEEIHGLLRAAANAPAGGLPEEEEDRLLELETLSAAALQDAEILKTLRVIRPDGAGPSDDEKAVDFNTLLTVEKVESVEQERTIQWNGGPLVLKFKRYTATSADYEVADASREDGKRTTHNTVSSNAEGFVERDGEPKPFGGASALLARLLEAKAAGLA